MVSISSEISPADAAVARLFARVRNHWVSFGVIALIFAIAGYALSYTQPVLYRATTVFTIAEYEGTRGGLGSMLGSLQGLAAAAGVELPHSAEKSEVMAALRSKRFARDYILSQKLVRVVCSLYCKHLPQNGIAAGEADSLANMAADAFTDKIRAVEEDKVAGVAQLSVVWTDAAGAARITNEFLAYANEELRQRARNEGEQSLQFLKRELEKTDEVSLRQGLYQLAERESGKIMMANVRKDYAFRVIDPAVAPQPWKRDSPRRSLWAIGFGVLGLIAMAVWLGFRSSRAARAR